MSLKKRGENKKSWMSGLFFNVVFLIVAVFCIFIVFVSILVLINSIPFEERGVNHGSFVLPVNVYIVNNEGSSDDVYYDLQEANRIWESYNVSFKLNRLFYVNTNLSDRERFDLYYDGIGSQQCGQVYDPIMKKIMNISEDYIKIVYVDINDSSVQGRGCVCSCNFVLINPKKTTWSGWELAHELGHVLKEPVACWKWNLMTESGDCNTDTMFWGQIQEISFTLRKFFRPTFLNQQQVDELSGRIKLFE